MKKWAIALISVLLILSGCTAKDASKEVVKKEKQAPKEQTQTETKPDPYQFPLTGKGSEATTDGRAVAVMINNHPKARPQSGIAKADIVYEILAEGDMTRFLAIFQSEKPANVGPVRSARDYYIEVAKGLGAFYIAHGYSPTAKKLLDAGYVDNINGMVYDGTLFKRASFRKAPHNSYITFDNILKGAQKKNYSMTQTPPAFTFMTEDESKTITGEPAKSVMITYSYSHISDSTFIYDETLGIFKRYSGGEQTIDLETKEPVLIDNVFIIETSHKVLEDGNHQAIDLKSGGAAYLLQKGKLNKLQWENRNGRIVPVKDGAEVPFVPGRTWVNVVPGLQKNVSTKATE